jgi:glucosamine kinase
MPRSFFIGVDGGASKCIVRVEDSDGHLLGRAITGPANIRISVEQTWQSIYDALSQILNPLSLSYDNPDDHFHAGLGLAGCECEKQYHDFLSRSHPFSTLKVISDAHMACLSAHGGKDGAIIIAGTGVVGWQIENGIITKVSGYGFPHDDQGSGAWLGLQAVSLTLQAIDGRLPKSFFTNTIFNYFQNNVTQLLEWANQATSTDFAKLAPLIIDLDNQNDKTANELLRRAANAIDQVFAALQAKQQDQTKLHCALLGGIAPYLQKYIGEALKAHWVAPLAAPDEGAVKWIKQCVS